VALKPCLTCGTLAQGPRCDNCRRMVGRAIQIRKRDQRPRVSAEDERRRRVVDTWRTTYGDLCPGWGVDAHRSADLTADHVVPVAAGGSEQGDLTVLCRACNARKRASVQVKARA
jgi:5-methylcytosine-specific restriction protein A